MLPRIPDSGPLPSSERLSASTAPPRPRARLRGLAGLLRLGPAIVLGAMTLSSGPSAVGAGTGCSTTSGPGYVIQVCLSPAGGTKSGTFTISATSTVSSVAGRVAIVSFCLDGAMSSSPGCVDGGPGYLLADFNAQSQVSQTQSIWTFSLPSSHWKDGAHGLLAVATMRDGTRTAPALVSLTFSNGNSTQPVNGSKRGATPGTKPASGKPLVVAAVGDGAGGDAATAAVTSRIEAWSPNLFLYLGDVYQFGSYTELRDWYQSGFGSLKAITDPVIGNHEYLSSSDPGTASTVVPPGIAYFDFWNNLPDYYSFDAGGWHFIALNSNQVPMTAGKWKAQLSWLQSDLASHPSTCTIAYWHHPEFNIGREPVPGSAGRLWSMLAGHVALVLNGHDHTYQRWQPLDASGAVSSAGTVEIVAGTGGHAAAAFVRSDSRVAARATGAGALRLSLGARSASVSFVSAAGNTLDSATIPCH